jgi:predicted RNase H-like HicB family nuclease
MKIQYPILIEPEDDNKAWGIIVPDLQGCFSAADNEAYLLDNAREAILLHLESVGDIPEPTALEKHRSRARKEKLYLSLVDVDLSLLERPAKRINVTIPAGVLLRIDAAARTQGKNRSAFLTESALKNM